MASEEAKRKAQLANLFPSASAPKQAKLEFKKIWALVHHWIFLEQGGEGSIPIRLQSPSAKLPNCRLRGLHGSKTFAIRSC